jgi:hypothetical protein
MGVKEMHEVAQLIARATREQTDVPALTADIATLIARFSGKAHGLDTSGHPR